MEPLLVPLRAECFGHLGDTNETMLLGALSATEMALTLAGVPHKKGGVQAAMDSFVAAYS
jgi:alanine-glyoxylate transaminase / serine-glyoxylate transaminase / serine-pyruvate transaminase